MEGGAGGEGRIFPGIGGSFYEGPLPPSLPPSLSNCPLYYSFVFFLVRYGVLTSERI
jgi:hypothetical protein